jgi:signal peptidase II
VKSRVWFAIVIWLGLILIDQGVKLIVRAYLPALIYKNPGIAFGIFSVYGEIVLWLVLIGILIFGCWLIRSKLIHHWLVLLGGVFILSGAISNLLDRLFFGYVIDFLGGLKWQTVFNLADIYIIIGCILFFVFFWQEQKSRA